MWREKLKDRFSSFATNYSQRVDIDKALKVKASKDSLYRVDSGADSLEIGLGKQALERADSDRNQVQIIRHRLTKMSNEAVSMSAELQREEIRRGSDRYIREDDNLDRGRLQSTKDMCAVFRRYFQNSFTKEPGLCDEEFCRYLTDFP